MVLVGLLNHAAEKGLLEKLPAMRKLNQSEDDCARERVLDAEEYPALLAASPRWLQRVLIAAHEACFSRVDLLTLTVDELHRKRPETAMIKVAGGRNKTKAKQKVPISPLLAEVLDEIDGERRKLTSLPPRSRSCVHPGWKTYNRRCSPEEFRRCQENSGHQGFSLSRFSTLRRHSLDFGGHSGRAAKDCCWTQTRRHSRKVHQRA